MNIDDMGAADAPLDVLIVGAGLSGIGAACHLTRDLPRKTWAILEGRDALGGTWDLFRYPGIRSDSDLYTFGYDFQPWKSDKAIADGATILAYLRKTAADYGIDQHIRYGHRVVAAAWDSTSALWTVTVRRTGHDGEQQFRSRWLFCAAGYYDYEHGYSPSFEGAETFRGLVIHPQHWPADFDHAGKRVAVIGSGATAVTVVPAMAETAAHVTMIQRTPTYVLPMPTRDALASRFRRWLPERLAYRLSRRKNIIRQRWIWRLCQRYPQTARRIIRWANRKSLPPGFPVDEHFNPPYDPWDQRLCVVPDGDLFRALGSGRASIVTGPIERFTAGGIRLATGQEIAADVIVTATGLNLRMFGGVAMRVDGKSVEPSEHVVFKGMMLDGLPNFCFAIGYTNSSWTLKIGLLCKFFCRLMREMDARGDVVCVPEYPSGGMGTRPLLDFGAGYVRRSLDALPKQGNQAPWQMTFDYISDERLLGRGPVIDPAMRLSPAPSAVPARAVAEIDA